MPELEGVFSVLRGERSVTLVVVIKVLCLLLFASTSAPLISLSSSTTIPSSSLTLVIIESLLEGLGRTSAVLQLLLEGWVPLGTLDCAELIS